MTAPGDRVSIDLLSSYRIAGIASAAAGEASLGPHGNAKSAAFFDLDNTLIRGASIFHFALGLTRRKFFTAQEIAGFAMKQLKFLVSGSEDLEDLASVITTALSFVEGRSVAEINTIGEIIFNETMVDKLIPGSLALAQAHLDAGQQVWLVTATPIELATMVARRLGLTGALGTVSQTKDGAYTGHLIGPPLHGLAKAEAVAAIAAHEGMDLANCSAYSDSSNDIPMLSSVGNPVAVNPDSTLRAHAKEHGWDIHDFRRRAQLREYSVPAMSAASGLAAGLAIGYLAAKARKGT